LRGDRRKRRTLGPLVAAAATAAAACALAWPAGAAAASCGSPAATAAVADQERALLCLVDGFRRSHGLRPLQRLARLDVAARLKARAIVECGQFSHTPCGRSFSSTFARAGYRSTRVGENLAWGTRGRGTARAVFGSLVASPSHRANFLSRRWRHVGIHMRRGPLFGYRGANLWVVTFGRR
jgi:uncharacterized protein YkwD